MTKGERTTDSEQLFQFTTTFPFERKNDLEGQTRDTASVWLDKPLLLTGDEWHTISFDKTLGTYIYYGSGITSNPLTFGLEKKTITFKKAKCDQYDNTESVG